MVKSTTPKVYLISRPSVNWDDVYAYLDDIGGSTWTQTQSDARDAESLIEFGGRLCYRSWEPGLNANVTRVRKDRAGYFENLIQSGHGSVLEHANFSFVFHNVSRVFTHELVRHRAGVAISQESLRYVRLTDLGIDVEAIESELGHKVTESFLNLVEQIEAFQVEAANELDLDNLPFSEKKKLTSTLRRVAPMGLSTGLLWTANIRTLRHVIEMRTNPHAEQEIRRVFDQVASLMIEEAPLLFADYARTADGTWHTEFGKV